MPTVTPWEATIVKNRTDNGEWVLLSTAYSVGDMVEIDLDSRRVESFRAADGQIFSMEVVSVVDTTEPKILIPMEMIEL